VKFFSGASESLANVRLLNDETVAPGDETWLQLRLRDAISLTQRDRFILRFPSPAQTIGGGLIINPHPQKRWKRFQKAIIADLQTRLEGTPSERIVQAADKEVPQKYVHLQKETGYNDDELNSAIEEALSDNKLIHLPDDTFWARSPYQAILGQIDSFINDYHRDFPLRLGIPREELRSRIGLKNALLTILLEVQEHIVSNNNLLKISSHEIRFSQKQEKAIEQLAQTKQSTTFIQRSE
jgi:selenocysteine-specific elongation factor